MLRNGYKVLTTTTWLRHSGEAHDGGNVLQVRAE